MSVCVYRAISALIPFFTFFFNLKGKHFIKQVD